MTKAHDSHPSLSHLAAWVEHHFPERHCVPVTTLTESLWALKITFPQSLLVAASHLPIALHRAIDQIYPTAHCIDVPPAQLPDMQQLTAQLTLLPHSRRTIFIILPYHAAIEPFQRELEVALPGFDIHWILFCDTPVILPASSREMVVLYHIPAATLLLFRGQSLHKTLLHVLEKKRIALAPIPSQELLTQVYPPQERVVAPWQDRP